MVSVLSCVPSQQRKRQEDGFGLQGSSRQYTVTTTQNRSYQQMGSKASPAMFSLPPIQASNTVDDPSGGLPPFNLAHSSFGEPASNVYFEETTVHTKRAGMGGFAGALASGAPVVASTTTNTASCGSKRLALMEPPGDCYEGEQDYGDFAWDGGDDGEEIEEEAGGVERDNDGGSLVDQDEAFKGDLAGASDYGYEHGSGAVIYSILNECGGISPLMDRY